MFRPRPHKLLMAAGACAALLLATATAGAQQAAPGYASPQAYDNSDQAPGRVARLAYLNGQVQFAPTGEDSWGSVDINRPMVIGDRLLTGDDGRAVLELGDASVRLDHDSAFDFLNLDQDNVQIELSQGTLNLAVHQMDQGANFEVDTPTVAFVASTPGIYRIDNDPDGTGSIVTVFQGSGVVYGENGASHQVAAGQSYRFDDSTLAHVEVDGLPESDDFDRFCEARDQNYRQYAQQSQQYLPSGMIGGQDLDRYGQWSPTPDYGTVWYPNTVPTGWAPYRYGRWVWIAPWGWTWVDNQPWGFAPFHYGRWVYVRNRWGWMPGPVNVRPVYAPALVGFLGNSGVSLSINIGSSPVGWFPLGPRDVYVPWFHASRGYFTNVNITNIRRVYVNRTVLDNCYRDYRAGRHRPYGRHAYPYRHMPRAVTAVNRNVFTGARPVHPAVLKLDRNRLARFDVANRPGVNPGKASLGIRNPSGRPDLAHGRKPFTRPVVARHEPPPRPVPFATRRKVIATQHGQPLTPVQLRRLQQHHATRPDERRDVKLVAAGKAGHVPPLPAEPRAIARGPANSRVPPRPSEPVARRGSGPARPPFKNTVQPIPAPTRPIANRQTHNTPPRPNELPSARFAHPERRAAGTLPRAPVIRRADNDPARKAGPDRRLPVVRPVQTAPRSISERNRQSPKPIVRAPPRSNDAGLRVRQQQAQRNRQQQAQRQAAHVRQQPVQRPHVQQTSRQPAQRPHVQTRQPVQRQPAFRAHTPQVRPVQARPQPQVRHQPQRSRPEPRATPRRATPPPRSDKQHGNHRERRQ